MRTNRTATTPEDLRSATGAQTGGGLAGLAFGVAMIDDAHRFIEANDAFLADLGTRAGLGDKRLDDFVHPDDRASMQAILIVLKANPNKPQRAELRFLKADGATCWMLAAFTALPKESGIIDRYSVQIVDIDRTKRMMEDIAEREQRWNYALVNSGLGVWDQNVATHEMYYSDTWYKIRGLSPDEPLSTSTEEWLLNVHPDDRDRLRHDMMRQNAGDPGYTVFQYRERHKDGHWVWIECRGGCVEWDKDGMPMRVMGTDIDVTARKEAEEIMAQLSRRLKLALDVSRVGVFEADFDTGACDWDDGMYTIFGVNKQTAIEIDGVWERLIHPEDLERVERNVAYHLELLLPFSDEYRIITDDGEERFIRSRTLPFIDADGRRKMIGANWDVTQDLSLHRELERARNLTEARNRELEEAQARIEHNAMHDYLTDLPNRRFLDEKLVEMADRARRDNGGIAVFHIDLDRFKQINDTLGHRAGDSILQHVASVLKENVRTGDFIARIGGDEFVVLSPIDRPTRKLANLADRIIRELCRPFTYDGHVVRFGASIGIACQTGEEIDANQLLLNADIALYRAKGRGRNRHEFFSVELQDQIVRAKRLADEILTGLEQKQFFPFYQPQFSAKTLDIVGVETLARWMHPTRGVLTPDTFLTVAEDLDVVSTIDSLILEKSLSDLDLWRQQGIDIPRVSVNVSSRRLMDPSLIRKLKTLKIEPGTVSFELLESIFLDDCDDSVISNLAKIRRLGIDIEIDDFGTGHASIVSLLKIGPKTLKIDREIIRPITVSQDQRKLVRSIIEIGKSLKIQVVAEGVETFEHVRILQKLDCDILQGYALARPMPFSQIAAFTHERLWHQLGTVNPIGATPGASL